MKQTDAMDVSVVVCTYNRATSLRLTLDALAGQVTPPTLGWELVVIDNNSADATPSVVAEFAAAAKIPVRYRFEPRQGLSHARNTGIGCAAGGIVAFTDDDVQPDPEWVSSIVTAMDASSADVLGGRILPLWSQPPPPWLEGRPRLRFHLAIMEYEELTPVVKNPWRMPSVWGANMAFRKEVFDKIGMFDVNRGMKGTKLYRDEDDDLVKRAIAAGYRVVYDPRVLVWHRIGADRMCVRYFSRLFFHTTEGKALVQGAPQARLLLGVPVKNYWLTTRRLWAWLRSLSCRRPDTLDRWLELCEALGLVSGFWKLYRKRGKARVSA